MYLSLYIYIYIYIHTGVVFYMGIWLSVKQLYF